VRLFVIARHAHSTLNLERRINGDPSVPVPLTEQGEEEARQLGIQVANVPIDACVHTRFPRTRETAAIALAGRDVPTRVEPLLDDIDVGNLEGQTIDEYGSTRAPTGFPAARASTRRRAATRTGSGSWSRGRANVSWSSATRSRSATR